MEALGRRGAHLASLCPALCGWGVVRAGRSAAALLVGRVLCGVTGGATVTLGAVVIGEYTSPGARPAFLNLKTTAFVVGGTLTHLLAHYYHWRTVALLSALPIVVAFLNMLTWPESPAWLISKKQFERSELEFYKIRGKTEKTIQEYQALLLGQKDRLSERPLTFVESVVGLPKRFTERDFVQPVALIFMSFFLLEACGRHYFPAYATDILDEIVSDKSQSFFFTMSIDVITVISASFSCVLAKLYKRRLILFVSGILGVIAIMTVSLYLYFVSAGVISKDRPWIPLSLLVMFFVLTNLGCTPIPLALLGELFPLRHRAAGSCVGGIVMSVLLLISLKITPTMLTFTGVHGTLAGNGVAMVISLVYLYYFLPETKDKTLQEIEDYFKGRATREENMRAEGAHELMLKEKS